MNGGKRIIFCSTAVALVVSLLGISFLAIWPLPIFSPVVLEMGDTYGNTIVDGKFHVFNLGLRSLRILDYRGSCTCLSITGPSIVAPLSLADIDVAIKSRGISGEYRVDLAVQLQGNSTKCLTIFGNRIITCRADPAMVDFSTFDRVSPNHLQQELTFWFSEPVPAQSIRVVGGSNRLKINAITKLVGEISMLQLGLDYDCTGERGAYTDFVKINYMMHKPAEYTVQVVGRLPGGLELDPEQVDISSNAGSNKREYEVSLMGLQPDEKVDNVKFSKNIDARLVKWNVEAGDKLCVIFPETFNWNNIEAFSLLVLTNKGQSASVYFSK